MGAGGLVHAIRFSRADGAWQELLEKGLPTPALNRAQSRAVRAPKIACVLSWAFRHRHRLQLIYGLSSHPMVFPESKPSSTLARQGTTAHRARYVVIHPMAPPARRQRAR
jgi:hypothetical protein